MDTTNVILSSGLGIDTLKVPDSEAALGAVNAIRAGMQTSCMPKHISTLSDASLFRKYIRLMHNPNGHTRTAYLKLDRSEREDVVYRLIKKQRRAS
jgi:hypothetical protein